VCSRSGRRPKRSTCPCRTLCGIQEQHESLPAGGPEWESLLDLRYRAQTQTPGKFRLSGTDSGTGNFCMTAAVRHTKHRPGVHDIAGPDSSCVVSAGFSVKCSSTSQCDWVACWTSTHASPFDRTAPWRLQTPTMSYSWSGTSMISNVSLIARCSPRAP